MSKQPETYNSHVLNIEKGLKTYAKKSFEIFSPKFVNGGSILDHYEDMWVTSGVSLKLKNRTPLQLERDRILILRWATEAVGQISRALQRSTQDYSQLHDSYHAHGACNSFNLWGTYSQL